MTYLETAPFVKLAYEVGEMIMPYWGNVAVELKSDESPVTVADKKASNFAINRFKELTPNIPVVSEEQKLELNHIAARASLHWELDPIDGTRSFIEGEKGFGIHMGLIHNGTPIEGIAYFPAQKKMFFTEHGKSFLQMDGEAPKIIQASSDIINHNVTASVPWDKRRQPNFINRTPYDPMMSVGGEAICQVAEGRSNVAWMQSRGDGYSHWDVAAAHAILKNAGGELYDMNALLDKNPKAAPIRYDNDDFSTPPLIAGSKGVLEYLNLLNTRPALSPQITVPVL